MKIKTFTGNGRVQTGNCKTDTRCYPVYNPGCESTGPECCPAKCAPEPCPPFHARDALRIREFEVERVFDIRSACGDRDFLAIQRCIRMEFKRPCDCEWTLPTSPLKITADGHVVFRWPTCFLNAPPGYWYARLLIDGEPVKYLPLYKPFAKVNVHSTEAIESDRCGTCHHDRAICCCERPEVDQEAWVEEITCGECRD